jgi:hypothetical protein
MTAGKMPSQRRTRRIDFIRGHTPTTQIGGRGFWTGRATRAMSVRGERSIV